MIVETERLILRPFRLTDAEEYYEITRDKKINKYVETLWTEDLNDTMNMIELDYSQRDFRNEFAFVLQSKATSKIIGALVGSKNFKKEIEMNIFVTQNERRKGYMPEAITAFVESLPKGSKLIFFVRNDNYPSLNMVQKLKNVKDFTDAYRRIDKRIYGNWRVFKIYT